MKDLNVRQDSIKILEENTGNTLSELSHSNFLQDTSTKAKETKAKNELLGLHQDKKLLHSKGYSQQNKRQPTEWEKIFANDVTDKVLVSKNYKEFIKFNTQKTNNPIKKWAEDVNRHFSKEHMQMANRHMKRCSTSLIIGEMQIKTTIRCHLTPIH